MVNTRKKRRLGAAVGSPPALCILPENPGATFLPLVATVHQFFQTEEDKVGERELQHAPPGSSVFTVRSEANSTVQSASVALSPPPPLPHFTTVITGHAVTSGGCELAVVRWWNDLSGARFRPQEPALRVAEQPAKCICFPSSRLLVARKASAAVG